MESLHRHNVRDGQQTYYYPNGQVYYRGLYKDDVKSGIWEFFTNKGISDTLINYNE